MRKFRRRTVYKFAGLSFVFLLIISILGSAFILWQIYLQINDLSKSSVSLDSNNLGKLQTKVNLLKLTTSNPIMAVGSSILITPGSYRDFTTVINSSASVLNHLSRFEKENNQTYHSLVELIPVVQRTMPEINALLGSLSHFHLGGILSPLDHRLIAIREESKKYEIAAESLAPLVDIFPSLVGSNSPRKYLVAFQNSAEARGSGGILGAYAILSVKKGKIKFTQFGSNASLQHRQDIPIKMPPEFVRLYNDDPGIWQNANISAHFPYGAKIWLALWERQFNEKLDGVLTFDPNALSYLLKATGAVTVNRSEIDFENVVTITLSDVYKKYELDNNARKKFLMNVVKSVASRIEDANIPFWKILFNLVTPFNEHRILLYSTNQLEQREIEKSSISGAISRQPDNVYRLIIQNISGNKMDYYLRRVVKIESLQCLPIKKTKVTFSLTNSANPQWKLPSYVAGRLDLNRTEGLNNSYGTRAILLAPVGARIVEAKNLQTNKKFGFFVRERTHPGIGVELDIAANQTQSFSVTFAGGAGKIGSYVQPLVDTQKNFIADRCSK